MEKTQQMHDRSRVTLITGASAGIGTELARVFASKGHRLALVDRRGDRLATLASEIVAAGGTAPILIACDLERPDACDSIAATLAANGVEVEFVVNNAGFGLFGHAIELDRAEQLGIIAVNIRALTDLSLRFSDSLIRHRGGILNLGSLAGFLPVLPGLGVKIVPFLLRLFPRGFVLAAIGRVQLRERTKVSPPLIAFQAVTEDDLPAS